MKEFEEVALVNSLGGDHKTAVLVLLVTVFTWYVEVLSWWAGQVVELVFPAKKVQYVLKSRWLKDSSVFDLDTLLFYQGGISECTKILQVQKLALKRVHTLSPGNGGVIGGAAPPSPQGLCWVTAYPWRKSLSKAWNFINTNSMYYFWYLTCFSTPFVNFNQNQLDYLLGLLYNYNSYRGFCITVFGTI